MDFYVGSVQLVRLIFQRFLAGIYLVAFVSALNQFPALLGEKGLLPVPEFVRATSFFRSPSLFYFAYSDRIFTAVAWTGIVLSLVALLGLSELGTWWLSLSVWLAMWVLYLSIVNVGQEFYSFGWETMLLEAGFFAAFLGPANWTASVIPVLLLRWMLFRTELGAGLIKLRGDECWRNLSCLSYHFETQPLPNPLSWFFHHSPPVLLAFGVLFSHFVQVIAPFGLFAPQPWAAVAGALIISQQLVLIVSGNYSWLNWLTVVLGVTAFSDMILAKIIPVPVAATLPRPAFHDGILIGLAVVTLFLSIRPTLNLFSSNQCMNCSYNPIHLVNSYGAFGSVTRQRFEIVLEGTRDAILTERTPWREYKFKAKPGDVKRMPPQVAPYHLRLDWLMWFLPFSVEVTPDGILKRGDELWFARFVRNLLRGDRQTLKLLGDDPFPGRPPHFIRARFYLYQFTDWKELKATGAWWKRTLIDDYLPPVALSDLRFL